VLNPLEVKAGMDAPTIRKRYGRRLALYGNLAATTLAGPQADLQASLERLAPLAREGGYILHTDHSCPPDVSLERYRWMLRTARSIFAEGGTQ
jgi:uroporphyrinogen-III decarboxylase